jgi:vitamin B12 transporter
VTYVDDRLHDKIFVVFLPPLFEGTPQNRTSLSKQQGVEAFVTSRIGEQWRVDASYTHLHARQNGIEEVRRAPDIASLNVTWAAPRQLGSITGTVRYNGRQKDVTFTDPTFATTPIVTLASYTLVDVAAEAKLTTALGVFGRVENLTDKTYEDVFSYRAPGRAFYAGVRARF